MRKLRWTLAIVSAFITLGGAAVWIFVRPWWHGWGVDPNEAVRPLPGDNLIPDAPISDTRAITVERPASAVWPWLVQMGFGRAGWYSYDAVDMRGNSAREILPDHQSLEVGDIVPTHPAGGFEVRAVEPGHALVLYIDSDLVRAQAEAAKEAASAGAGGGADGAGAADGAAASPANLRAAGAFMGGAQPSEFTGTWAFVVEPLGPDRSRLIERFRVEFTGGDKPWTKVTLPLMGFGVFAMMRKQLLGIRERVEAAS